MTIGINISKISKRADLSLQLSMSDEVIVNTLDQTFTCTLGDLRDAIHTQEQMTKHSVGLGNVNNTSDFNKPISLLTLEALDGKANLSHGHKMGDIEDLLQSLASIISALALKAAIEHGHAMDEVTGLGDALDAKADEEHLHAMDDVLELEDALDGKAAVVHEHAIDDTTGLQTELDGKAPLVHKHTISEVCDLQDVLDTRSVVGHIHCISEVKLLQDELDDRSRLDHGHIIDDIELLREEFNKKSDTDHGHCIKDVGGLTGILEAKSDADHDHAIADVALLQRTLDEKALLNHTHASVDLSDIYLLLAGKSSVDHTHCASAIEGLDLLLAAKAAIGHDHDINDVNLLQAALDGKSGLGHTHLIADTPGLQDILDNITTEDHSHAIADTTGLQDALDGKAGSSHTHAASEVTGLSDLLDDKSDLDHGHIIADTTGLQDALDGKALVVHTHVISDIAGLQDALDSKSGNSHTHGGGTAPIVHTHAIADTVGLQDALDGKALIVHTHAIADTTGLQDALDAKAGSSHTHAAADITGLSDLLDDKSDLSHGHIIADTTGLQDALDGKALVVHTHAQASITGLVDRLTGIDDDIAANTAAIENHDHAIADVTGLQAALDGKALIVHSHAQSDITGLVDKLTAIDDAIGGKTATGHNHVIDDTTGLQTALDNKSDIDHTHPSEGGMMDSFLTTVTLSQPYAYYPLDDADSPFAAKIGNAQPFTLHLSSVTDSSVYEKAPIKAIHSTNSVHVESDVGWTSPGHIFPNDIFAALLIQRSVAELMTQATLMEFTDFKVVLISGHLTVVDSSGAEFVHPTLLGEDIAYAVSVTRTSDGKYADDAIVLTVNGVDAAVGYSNSATQSLLSLFSEIDNTNKYTGDAQHLFLSNITMDSSLRAELGASYLGINHAPEFKNLAEGFVLSNANANQLVRVNSTGTQLEPYPGKPLTESTIVTKMINIHFMAAWWGTCVTWGTGAEQYQIPGYEVDHCHIMHTEFFNACTHISANPATHKAYCAIPCDIAFAINISVDVASNSEYGQNGVGGSGAVAEGCGASGDLENEGTCVSPITYIRQKIGSIRFEAGKQVGYFCIKDGADFGPDDKINLSMDLGQTNTPPGKFTFAINTQQTIQLDKSLSGVGPGVVIAGGDQSGTPCS